MINDEWQNASNLPLFEQNFCPTNHYGIQIMVIYRRDNIYGRLVKQHTLKHHTYFPRYEPETDF